MGMEVSRYTEAVSTDEINLRFRLGLWAFFYPIKRILMLANENLL